MERRTLGRTGRELSIIGLGGVVFVGMNDTEATAIASEAIIDLIVNEPRLEE